MTIEHARERPLMGFNVSEYIPESGIYHQSKVTRPQIPSARQFAMRAGSSRQSSLPEPEPWGNGGPGIQFGNVNTRRDIARLAR